MFDHIDLPQAAESMVVPSMCWAGTRFGALVVPNYEEIDRRAAAGFGSVIDYRTLEVLSPLPTNVEVPWHLLDPVIAAYASSLSNHVVSMSDDGVTSLLSPPFHELVLVKRVPSLRAVGSFPRLAQHVQAVVVLQRIPRGFEDAIAQAERWGVGLGVNRDNEVVLAAPPQEPKRDGIIRTRIPRWCLLDGYLRLRALRRSEAMR